MSIFQKSKKGSGLVVYAIIIGLISITSLSLLSILGNKVSRIFVTANNSIEDTIVADNSKIEIPEEEPEDPCKTGPIGTVCQDGSQYVGTQSSVRYYIMALAYPTLPWQEAKDYCVLQGGALPSNMLTERIIINNQAAKFDFFPDYNFFESNPYWVTGEGLEIENNGVFYILTLYIQAGGSIGYANSDMSVPGEFFCVKT